LAAENALGQRIVRLQCRQRNFRLQALVCDAHSFEPHACTGVFHPRLLAPRTCRGSELAVHVRAQQFVVEFETFAHFAALTRCGPSPRLAASLARAPARRLITGPTGTSAVAPLLC